MTDPKIEKAAHWIREAKHAIAFTGAGISVDSGIPAFRGKNGLWETVDPIFLEIGFFNKMPLQSWTRIKEVFYDRMVDISPNIAHKILAKMEERSFLEAIITQNIDHLHQDAGSKKVIELHGSYKQLVCTGCQSEYDLSFANLNYLPPTCFVCKGILKPDIVFFNEPIPKAAEHGAFEEAGKADLLIIVGTHAEVLPAAHIPEVAKENGAKIIEINITPSHISRKVSDLFLEMTASDAFRELKKLLYL